MNALLQLADRLFSKLSRVSRADADGYATCICCGGKSHWSTMDPAHFVGRGNMFFRWKMENVYPCHRICHEAKDHLTKYRDALVRLVGVDAVCAIEVESKKYHKAPNEAEIVQLCDSLQVELQEYASADTDAVGH